MLKSANLPSQVIVRRSSVNLEVGQVWRAGIHIYPDAWMGITIEGRKHNLQPCEKFIIAKQPNNPEWYLDGDDVEVMLTDGQHIKLPRWAFEQDQFLSQIGQNDAK